MYESHYKLTNAKNIEDKLRVEIENFESIIKKMVNEKRNF